MLQFLPTIPRAIVGSIARSNTYRERQSCGHVVFPRHTKIIPPSVSRMPINSSGGSAPSASLLSGKERPKKVWEARRVSMLVARGRLQILLLLDPASHNEVGVRTVAEFQFVQLLDDDS